MALLEVAGPLTAERDGIPVDLVARLEHEDELVAWQSPDRWHYCDGELTQPADGVYEVLDADGVRWRFRPTIQADANLVTPLPDPPPADFVAWVTPRLAAC